MGVSKSNCHISSCCSKALNNEFISTPVAYDLVERKETSENVTGIFKKLIQFLECS